MMVGKYLASPHAPMADKDKWQWLLKCWCGSIHNDREGWSAKANSPAIAIEGSIYINFASEKAHEAKGKTLHGDCLLQIGVILFIFLLLLYLFLFSYKWSYNTYTLFKNSKQKKGIYCQSVFFPHLQRNTRPCISRAALVKENSQRLRQQFSHFSLRLWVARGPALTCSLVWPLFPQMTYSRAILICVTWSEAQHSLGTPEFSVGTQLPKKHKTCHQAGAHIIPLPSRVAPGLVILGTALCGPAALSVSKCQRGPEEGKPCRCATVETRAFKETGRAGIPVSGAFFTACTTNGKLRRGKLGFH